MREKTKSHFLKMRTAYQLAVFFIVILGATIICQQVNADTPPVDLAITNVVLADVDTTGYGLDGRDFRVTWTSSTTVPTGYQMTSVYITTSGVQLTTSTLFSTGCNGSACSPWGSMNQFSMATWTLPQFMKEDSTRTALATSSSYIAWVYVQAASPFIVSSSIVSYADAFDSVTDINAPQIMHSEAHAATQNIAAVLYANVFDDQTSAYQFANIGDGGAEYFRLYYTSSTWPGSPAFVNAVAVSGAGELFSFTIPAGSVPAAGGTVRYYLVAKDNATTSPNVNVRFFCASPNATSSAGCQSSPFAITTVAAGSRVVSGTITGEGLPLVGATVFAGGYAKAAVTTTESGVYSISGLPNNDVFDFTATTLGYAMGNRRENIGTSNKTGINININRGGMGFFDGGGGGGDMGGAPHVIFSGPQEGIQGFPITENLRVGFSQPLDSTTVTTVSSVTSSNVYLVKTATGVNVPGSVSYCASQSSIGCGSIPSMDSNVILFNPTDDLATSTQYTLVVTGAVKSQGGQAVQGNRPEGGHRINFNTVGNQISSFNYSQGGLYGNSGMYMPPYVRSMSPAPGMSAAPNVSILLEFNEAMSANTIITDNISLVKVGGSAQSVTISLDSNERRFATISHSALDAGEYELRVKGAVANASNLLMRGVDSSAVAFSSRFIVASGATNDTVAPIIYPALTNNSTGVATNQVFEFGFNEQLAFSTINSSNIIMYRGATTESILVNYDPGKNSVYVASASALYPNTVYTITFNSTVTDLAGNGVVTTTYTYTAGSMDTTAPKLKEARCDDYRCYLTFNEPMNRDTFSDSKWSSSVINPANWTIARTAPSVATLDIAGKPMNYNTVDNSVTIEGVAGLAASDSYRVTAGSALKDVSDNTIETAGSANIFNGIVESSKNTFGSFGGGGMFGPPTENMMGTGMIGQGQFVPQGFGNFTADQYAFGNADMAYPFNQILSQDVNVFQVRFKPGVALVDGDKIAITFPAGTNVSSAVLDNRSPFYTDFNQSGPGTITGSAVAVDNATRKVTITLGIVGTPIDSDAYTIDLAKIINPSIPKGPSTGGYTVTLQAVRGTSVLASKTSMPYFIEVGGTNTITVGVYAFSSSTPTSGADGTIYLHGGGPSGPMEKVLTLADGAIATVDGTVTTTLVYSNLRDGCYMVGTEPFVTLGGTDYFGQMSPEQICVNASTPNKTKDIILIPSSGSNSIPVTVKLVNSGGFGGKNLDIFAGGPGKFVVKTLTNVTTPNPVGYTLQLPANGHWNIGVGPAASKGPSTGMSAGLGVMSPPPIDVLVADLGGSASVSAGMFTPPGVAFDDDTDTITITFASSGDNKTVTGTVKDVSGNGLSNIDVFLNRQGYGTPVFTQTNASGTFSLSVPVGVYEIGASKQGMPGVFKMVDVRSGGNYVDGKLVSGGNPFVLTMKKSSYTISGKVLDDSSNSISGASLMARNATGNTVFGMSGSDGSYTLFVDDGTWNIEVQMPPEKTDSCGSFSKSVTVSGASQSSQNISPSAGTCYTLNGTVTAGGATLNNVPLFIEEWDAVNSIPVAGGLKRPASTDSSGIYSVKVLANRTYRIGTWHPDYGELSATKAITTADATQNISVSADTVTFSFTGGLSTMKAMIEMKNSADKNKVIRKQINGLNATTAINVENLATYNYFVDVFGYGKYSGTVTSTVGSDTVTIDVSGSNYVIVTGTIKDADGNALSGASVNLINTSTNMAASDLTDSNGVYELKVKAGSYQMAASINGYVAPAPTNVSFSTNTIGYDFATGQDQSALIVSDYTIEGVVSSTASTVMTEGYVWATNASGTVVSAPIEADGTYSLPVTVGSWSLSAVGPLHSETDKSGATTVSNADQTGVNFILTTDATRIPTSTTGLVAASTGGSFNDSSGSGMKLTVGSGVLETGSGNVTVNMEKSFNAPDSGSYQALGNATFSIEATGESSIKSLNGNAEIQIDYTSLLAQMPSSTSEGSLQLMYYSPERGDYSPVEGGYTVDTVNNTVTGLVNHFTDFVLAFVPTSESAPATTTGLTATAASASQINLSWTAVSGATLYNVHRSTDGITYSDLASTANTTYSSTGLSASTLYYYKVTASNASGEGASSAAASATTNAASSGGNTISDTTPPTNTSIVIASGATSTASMAITLTLGATDASYMMIANDSAFTSSTWETYATTKSWTLTVGNGTKTVYAKFKDAVGNISLAVSDSIVLNITSSTMFTPTSTPLTTTPTSTSAASINAKATAVVTIPAVVSGSAINNSYVFNKQIKVGSVGAEVKELQKALKALGYFSHPTITGNFGSVTKAAVVAYQKANGLTRSGMLDSATRAKLNSKVEETPSTISVIKYQFKLKLTVGSSGEEVKQLQLKLKELGYYTYPNITGYYGATTKAAVVKFQKANGLKPYPGWVGPGTVKALNEK